MNKNKKLIFAALFLALGLVLPFFTSQIKEVGDSLLPMHFVVMFCGLVCGYRYGFIVGLILPYIRGLIFTMPPLFPNAVWMSFELATYGFVIGMMYFKLPKNKLWSIYASLITAMISGRVVWGIAKAILLGVSGKAFTIPMFISGGIIDAMPGIILQLVLIPIIIRIKDTRGVK